MAEVKDPAAVAWVQYPAEELLYAEDAAKKKKKKITGNSSGEHQLALPPFVHISSICYLWPSTLQDFFFFC